MKISTPQKHVALLLIIVVIPGFVAAQYLSHLSATKDDAVYTTYAAPMERSDYQTDRAWSLMWYHEPENIEFFAQRGERFGMAFMLGDDFRSSLERFYSEPVITVSYPDLVKFHFYPYRNIRVDVFFDVYSSTLAFAKYTLTNEGNRPINLKAFPYIRFQHKIDDPVYSDSAFFFKSEIVRDGWMREHDIPYGGSYSSVFLTFPACPDAGTCEALPKLKEQVSTKSSFAPNHQTHVFYQECTWQIQPGESRLLTLITGTDGKSGNQEELTSTCRQLITIDQEQLVTKDEMLFADIPDIRFDNEAWNAVYWNSFNLMRQCMMPPEGKCSYNYYVFSREPKWGWGYGGQVFHESLTMTAYALMDGESAMNSQRVFMERQLSSGYINYRTGPYLDEQIPYNGQLTSSAPWYNYENWEVYKITKDKTFLQQAYRSGKRFYNYFTANRDSDGDGLCEWGAHAELESVRDARVAVWDNVGWPANFEGPDINAMLVMEAKSLAGMARELHYEKEAGEWLEDAGKRSALINRYLWDSIQGFYFNVNKNDETFTYQQEDDLKIKEIIGFLPLWAGVADSLQAATLVAAMTDPGQFGRKYGIPSLSAEDDYYNPIGYWNGPVWVQWQYLVFRGLLDYGYTGEARALAEKVLDNMAFHLKNDHVFWEFYSADDPEAGWNKTYIWAGIAARMLYDLNNIP